VAEIRAGGRTRIDAVRLALQDAEVTCQAVKTAAARRGAQALASTAVSAPVDLIAAPKPVHSWFVPEAGIVGILRSPDPKPGNPSSPPASGSEAPADRASGGFELVETMRKDRPRACKQITFLVYMKDRSSATYSELADSVHANEQTSDDAIRADVYRVNRYLEEKGLTVRFTCGSGYVTRIDSPE
jgi:hypothetical protein